MTHVILGGGDNFAYLRAYHSIKTNTAYHYGKTLPTMFSSARHIKHKYTDTHLLYNTKHNFDVGK